MNAAFYDRSTTADGIEVLTETIDAVRSVAVGIWVRVGSRDEAPHEAGMSHFMEHMAFKGTPKRSAQEISAHFERLGAEFNAFTSKEYTCFFVRVIDERFEEAFEVLADMVSNASLAEDAILSEREVVLEEIARHDDTPDDAVHDLFAAELLKGHPLGEEVLGTRQTVGAFDRPLAVSFKQRHYTTGTVLVAAAGNVAHERVRDAATRWLALPKAERPTRALSQPSARPGLAVVTRDTEQAHICWGVPGLPAGSDQRFVIAVLDGIFGGGMASRLFQEVREKRGLAYAVYSYHSLYLDAGEFVVYAGTRPDNAREVVRIVSEEAARLASDGVSDEELERVRENMKGQLVLSLENTRSRMTRLGKSAATDTEILSIDELVARIDAVTASDVHALAQSLFSQPKTLAMIAPLQADAVADLVQ
ncbi:insulinase family protein [Coriobacteriia bacterium Es71-Z0120]|uniref:M16 family metallopeptidase n=1 Tax=Parvivirga hydrogeniphila TaxID=2939460 RepID=UPI002260E75F|nr:pitrilysin family protein [Parvivirga hydrogeniphila]MCL4079607.1 insulinase family protein [Parvivirga hydrogeniphila]